MNGGGKNGPSSNPGSGNGYGAGAANGWTGIESAGVFGGGGGGNCGLLNVSSGSGAAGGVRVTYYEWNPGAISSTGQTIPVGGTANTVTNSTAAKYQSGTATVSYRWKCNGTIITGATGASYTPGTEYTNTPGTYVFTREAKEALYFDWKQSSGSWTLTVQASCDATAGSILAGIWACSATDTAVVLSNDVPASSSTSGSYVWERSTDGGTIWNPIPGADDIDYNAKLTGTYRRGYSVTGCETVYTNPPVTVTRPSDINPGTLADDGGNTSMNVCSGGNVSVNLVANTTYSVTWQTSTNGNDWTDFSGSVTPFTVDGITTKTYVRYIAQYTATCGVPSDNIYTINIWTLPSVDELNFTANPCPGMTKYDITADITSSAAIDTYTWTGITNYTENEAYITPTLPNCGETYDFSLKVTDAHGCVSGIKNGTFTTTTPALTIGTIADQIAAYDASCNFSIPTQAALTAAVNAALTSTCGNAVTLSNINPPVGDPISVPTDVTATATDMCGHTTNVTITVVIPAAPTVNITTAEQYLCPGETTKLTTNVTAEEPTYEWTPASLGDKDTTRTIAYTGEDVNVHPDTFKVKVTDKYGCEAKGEIVIYTTPKAYIANQEHTVCTPNSVTFAAATGDKIPAASTTIGTNTFTSTTTYSWTIASNTGVTGASAATDQANFTTGTLTNGELTTQTVIYSVTPTTVTSFSGSEVTSCDGDAFTVTVNVKPTIETTGAIDPFDDADVIITLWYGACDTLYYVNAPAYTNNTDLTDVLSNNKATVNEGTTLLGRIAPGEYTIIWTVTDECGNHVDFPKKYIVRYPNCGDADPNYTEPYYAVDADDNVYHTVRIGCECWTASNLKTVTGAPNSMVYKCNDYPNETENEEKYGRLYTWYTAVNVPEGDNTTEPTVSIAAYSTYPYVHGICPTGWAIPSTENFTSMVGIAGGVNAVKSSSDLYWLPGAEGNDASGFGARGAGYYDSSAERFMNLMGETYFWTYETSSSYGGKCAVISYYCPELLIQDKLKGMGYSIRCIRRENP